MRFKVVQGQHWMNGQAYSSGSVVETNRRLDRTFPGRFEKIPEENPVVESKPEKVEPTPTPVVEPKKDPGVDEKTAEAVVEEKTTTASEKKKPTKRKVRTRRKTST